MIEATNEPGRIIAACFLLQFILFAIYYFMHYLLMRSQERESVFKDKKFSLDISGLLVLNLFLGCIVLLFSSVFVESWANVFGIDPLNIFSFHWETALTIFLGLGLLFLALMVYLTGGGINSPYITFFGLFPVLGILFKKDLTWMLWYLFAMFILGVFIFMINAPYEDAKVKRTSFRLSFLTGEISSILIATFIGSISI